MGYQMTKGLCVVYLRSRDCDDQMEVKVVGCTSLDNAIALARARVENLAFAGLDIGRVPVGFMIENSEGDELFRWFRSPQ